MNSGLTVLLGGALLLAGSAALEPLGRGEQAAGLSKQQFQKNCLGEAGRYAALKGRVVCGLGEHVRLICEFEGRLGNCLWTGPVQADALGRLLGGDGGSRAAA